MPRKKIDSRKIASFAVSLILIAVVGIAYILTSGSFEFGTGSQFDVSQDFVRFVDVGQGDCALIYSNGYSALIDTGTEDSVADVCAVLDKCGIRKIDVLLISHLHTDHTGGIRGISQKYSVDNVVLPELSIESEGLTDAQLIINKVTVEGGNVHTAKQGMNFKIGEFELTVLAALDDMKDENNRSLMVMAEMDGIKFMFTGDAETKAEKVLLDEGLNLKCDVFKAGHHGSSTSNCKDLLKAMKPKFIAISAGKNNMYGHPHNEVLSAFEATGATVYRTDYSGNLDFSIKNKKIVVSTEN